MDPSPIKVQGQLLPRMLPCNGLEEGDEISRLKSILLDMQMVKPTLRRYSSKCRPVPCPQLLLSQPEGRTPVTEVSLLIGALGEDHLITVDDLHPSIDGLLKLRPSILCLLTDPLLTPRVQGLLLADQLALDPMREV